MTCREFLASLDCCAEDVRVLPVVVPETELGNIERHVLAADLMETANDPALDERPKAIDGLGMGCAVDILACGVIDNRMGKFGAKMLVSDPLVGAKQAYFVRDALADESGEGLGVNSLDDPRHNIALAAHGSGDWRLARADAARSAALPALVDMLVLGLAADESLIDLDDAQEFTKMLVPQASPDAVAHIPSGAVRAETHVTIDLERADAFFAG